MQIEPRTWIEADVGALGPRVRLPCPWCPDVPDHDCRACDGGGWICPDDIEQSPLCSPRMEIFSHG